MLSKKQKYKDLPFFLSKNSFTSDINTINDLAAIRQSIKNLVLTNNGERKFNFDFGANLQTFLFENFSIELIASVQSAIAENLRLFEPRAVLNNIKVYENSKQNSIDVEVEYQAPDLSLQDIIKIQISRTR
jgi:phage baseplate assembly protein W